MKRGQKRVKLFSVEELNEKIPGHRVTEFIAKGGMGAVYKGVQENLDRVVAIKVLPPAYVADEGFRKAFVTEAKAMAKVSHGNLVRIYDFGEINDFLYIVMEFIEGRSLSKVINGVAVNQVEAAELIISVCKGLNVAHRSDIIHRDIKPDNILIDDGGRPKLVDFGLARPIQDTEEELIFGTQGYTAPEVVECPSSVDCRSDIFSIGAMLFELLCGRLPLKEGEKPSEVLRSNYLFDEVVLKATNLSHTMRYRSVMELVEDLQAIVDEIHLREGQKTQAYSQRVRISPKSGALLLSKSSSPMAVQAALRGKSNQCPRLASQKSSSRGLIALVGLLMFAVIGSTFLGIKKNEMLERHSVEKESGHTLTEQYEKLNTTEVVNVLERERKSDEFKCGGITLAKRDAQINGICQ